MTYACALLCVCSGVHDCTTFLRFGQMLTNHNFLDGIIQVWSTTTLEEGKVREWTIAAVPCETFASTNVKDFNIEQY